MPPYTSLRTLVHSLQTRTTNTTRALTRMLAALGDAERQELSGILQNGDAKAALLNAVDWGELDLTASYGLQPGEVDHMRDWLNANNDGDNHDFRQALVDAIKDNRRIRLFWEFHSGNSERTAVNAPGGKGPVEITFQSPQRRARTVGNDEVVIDVGRR